MPHLRPVSIAAIAVLAVLAVVLTFVLVSGDDSDDGPASADAACTTEGSAVLRALVDDRSVLPADNWVPVVRARGDFRDRLVRLDQVSRLISAEDVAAVVGLEGAERRRALRAGVADVPRGRVGRPFRLVVTEGETSAAVGDLYAAALERLGSATRVRTADASGALEAVENRRADTALVGLSALVENVGAEVAAGTDASGVVQAAATAALDRDLALGATSGASGTPQVLVPADLVESLELVTLSDLAAACGGSALAVTAGAEAAADVVAEAYDLEVSGEPLTDAGSAFTDDGQAVAVVVAAG